MKTCPVCKTMLFDDMEVCYGCMHKFGAEFDEGVEGSLLADASTNELQRETLQEIQESQRPHQRETQRQQKPQQGEIRQQLEPRQGESQQAKASSFVSDNKTASGEGAAYIEKAARSEENASAWTIKLEMKSKEDPRSIWAIELSVPHMPHVEQGI